MLHLILALYPLYSKTRVANFGSPVLLYEIDELSDLRN